MKFLKSRKLTVALFVIYLVVLAWVILWKNHFAFSFLGVKWLLADPNLQRSLNLIPLGGMLVHNGKPVYNEIVLNTIAFVPFGLFLGMLQRKEGFLHLLARIVITSLLFEILQYIFVLGASDITDVLANTLGGLLGLFLFFVLHKLCKEKVVPLLNALFIIAVVCFAGILSMVRPL